MSCPAAAQARAVMACLVPSHLPNVIQLPVQHSHGLQAEGQQEARAAVRVPGAEQAAVLPQKPDGRSPPPRLHSSTAASPI